MSESKSPNGSISGSSSSGSMDLSNGDPGGGLNGGLGVMGVDTQNIKMSITINTIIGGIDGAPINLTFTAPIAGKKQGRKKEEKVGCSCNTYRDIGITITYVLLDIYI